MPSSVNDYEIPQEVWLYIFRLATSTGNTQLMEITAYKPFQPVEDALTRNWWNQKEVFDTKRAIVLVCKLWRILAMEVLYEEIRIRHSTAGLLEGLERSSQELGVDGYARWVRRIVIDPVILDFDVFNPIGIPPILSRCTSVEAIIRPITQSANPPLCRVRSEFPILPTVKRVDWWLASAGPNRHKNPWSSDFLGHVLDNVPNLHYLTISGNRMTQMFTANFDLHEYPPHTLKLPSLKTLHLDCDSQDPVFAGTKLECPNLDCFIMGAPLPVCLPLLVACGTSLRIVEISKRHPNFVWPEDTRALVKPVLNHCPNLEELYLHIDQSFPASNIISAPIAHPRLKYFGLFASDAVVFWDFINTHSELFERFALPALECVGIDIDFTGWELDVSRFRMLEQTLHRRNCSLEPIPGSIDYRLKYSRTGNEIVITH